MSLMISDMLRRRGDSHNARAIFTVCRVQLTWFKTESEWVSCWQQRFQENYILQRIPIRMLLSWNVWCQHGGLIGQLYGSNEAPWTVPRFLWCYEKSENSEPKRSRNWTHFEADSLQFCVKM